MSTTTTEDVSDIIWQEPNRYQHFRHGPPYLKLASGAKGAVRQLVAQEGNCRVANRIRKNATMKDALESFLAQCVADYNDPDEEAMPYAELAAFLAFLRGATWVYQAFHWQTQGHTYYADHLLFERVYGDVYGLIDGVAEKAIGVGQSGLVDPTIQLAQTTGVVHILLDNDAITPESFVTISLRAALRILIFLGCVKDRLEQADQLSAGVSNMLDDIADKLEGHVYLLKQRAGGGSITDHIDTADSRWKEPGIR